jgi:hypothetical protein
MMFSAAGLSVFNDASTGLAVDLVDLVAVPTDQDRVVVSKQRCWQMRYEHSHGKYAVLGEAAFLKIDGQSAWRNHRLIVFAADSHRHACVTQDFDEGLGGGDLERVHSLSGVSIELETSTLPDLKSSRALHFEPQKF